VVVRELVALLGVKSDEQSFKKAEGGLGNLVSIAKTAAAAFAGLFIVNWARNAAQEVASLGDRLKDLSDRTGVSTSALQRLEHAAELSGASLGDIETGLRRLQASLVGASEDGEASAKEFDRLGISVRDSNGEMKNATTLLFEIADGMKNLKTDAERTTVATKLLGRGGMTLIPLLKGGSEALREMFGEMDALGGIMSTDMIRISDDYSDNQRRLRVAMLGVKMAVAKHLLPWLVKLQENFLEFWKANKEGIRKFIDNATRLVKTVWGMSKIFYRLVAALPAVAKIAILAVAFLKWEAAAEALAASMKLLLSPIGKIAILIGLLALIIEDLITWVEGGDSVFGKFFKTLDEITGLNISGSVKDTIKWFMRLAEDPVAAIEELKREWVVVWEEILAWTQSLIGADLYHGIATAFVRIFGFLNELFGLSFADMAKFWTDFYDGVVEVLDKVWVAVADWAVKVGDAIASPFKAAGEWISGLLGSKPEVEATVKRGSPPIEGIKTLVQGPRGIGATAVTAPQRGGGLNQSTDVQINVKAAPGMDEQRLATEVARRVGSEIQRQNRAAMRALVPGTV